MNTKSFILLSLLLGLVSCSDDTGKEQEVVPVDPVPEVVGTELPSYELRVLEDMGGETAPMTFTGALSEGDYAIVDAINEFSFKLFRKVRSNGSTGDNPFVSPFSVQQVLAMLCNATEGSVQSEILSALGYEEHSIEAFNSCNGKLLSDMRQRVRDTALEVSNAVWVQESYPVYRSFLRAVENAYSADVCAIDFGNEKAGDIINYWSNENTHGLIPEVVKPGPLQAVTLLANSVYFKARWYQEFLKSNTQRDRFTNIDGSYSEVDMMRTDLYMKYASLDNADVVSVPYIDNYSMMVFLPHAGVSADDFADCIDASLMKEVKDKQSLRYIDLQLPKFSLETRMDLTETLSALGIKQLAEGANLTKMSPDNLFISKMEQLTKLNVDEEGTEAAAVTLAYVDGDYINDDPTPTPIVFKADRPFLFLIRDDNSGAILFMGYVKSL